MSVSVRLDDDLFHQAEAEGRVFHRSPPRQIEFWADLGRRVSALMTPTDVVALLQGIATVRVETRKTPALDLDDVLGQLERDRTRLNVTKGAAVYYEASRTHPGLIDQVTPQGRRTGRFQNGEFIPV